MSDEKNDQSADTSQATADCANNQSDAKTPFPSGDEYYPGEQYRNQPQKVAVLAETELSYPDQNWFQGCVECKPPDCRPSKCPDKTGEKRAGRWVGA